ncbi:MAG TPA: hypothetical protein VNO31_05815 [Umezawaea sp.]|nr:hypothetical protein [Umezawaea sp.]
MRKITNLMTRAALVLSVAVVAVIGATATATASESAAQVPAAASSMSRVVQNEDPITIESSGDCITYLEIIRGYKITSSMRVICGLAALPYPAAHIRIAACIPALAATGVSPTDSILACVAATGP